MSSGQCLFLNENLSDVEIKVRSLDGRMWRFPAHSLILRANSSWFNEIIEEQNIVSPGFTTITFADVSPKSILKLLKFLYTGEPETPSSPSKLLDLLEVSIRCKVWQLEVESETKLLKNIRLGNACSLFQRASGMLNSGHGSRVVVDSCQKLILEYAQIVFASNLVLYLDRLNLEQLLQSDWLNVVDEDTVFAGVWKWGQNKCCAHGKALTEANIIHMVSDLLSFVRFSQLINPTVIPDAIVERYCKCTPKKSKGCCCLSEETKEKCRKGYRQPKDLFRQSSNFTLFEALRFWHTTQPHVDRLLCTQISVEDHIFLVALEVALMHPLPNTQALALSVTAEETSIELIREEINFKEISSCENGEDQVSFVKLTFSNPVEINRRKLYSFHLLLPNSKCEKWNFPEREVTQRKNLTMTEDGLLQINIHTDRVIAVSTIYYMYGG